MKKVARVVKYEPPKRFNNTFDKKFSFDVKLDNGSILNITDIVKSVPRGLKGAEKEAAKKINKISEEKNNKIKILNNSDTTLPYLLIKEEGDSFTYNDLFYALPAELSEFIINKNITNKISNYGLAIEKFGRFKENKLEYLNQDGTDLFHSYKNNTAILDKIHSRQKNILNQQQKNNFYTKSITLKQDNWRLVVGLTDATAYNNGFKLHKVYGVPYIPAQAMRGLLRSYLINTQFGGNEDEALKDDAFCLIFGNGKTDAYTDEDGNKQKGKEPQKGCLTVLDVFPKGNIQVSPDIMNPHYAPYYGDENNQIPPADYLDPTPIVFLTLKNTAFKFRYFISEQKNKKIENSNSPFNGYKPSKIVKMGLEAALLYHGIGAKTSVGYGRMSNIDDSENFETTTTLDTTDYTDLTIDKPNIEKVPTEMVDDKKSENVVAETQMKQPVLEQLAVETPKTIDTKEETPPKLTEEITPKIQDDKKTVTTSNYDKLENYVFDDLDNGSALQGILKDGKSKIAILKIDNEVLEIQCTYPRWKDVSKLIGTICTFYVKNISKNKRMISIVTTEN